MKIISKLSNGKLDKEASDLIRKKLASFSDNEEVEIEIKKTSKGKIKMYGYLYGIAYPILQEFLFASSGERYAIDDIDTWLKIEFWNEEVICFDEFGKPILEGGIIKKMTIPKRKREMTKTELVIFVTQITSMCWERFWLELPQNVERNYVIKSL